MSYIARLRSFWAHTAASVRWTTYVCLPLGIAAAVAGIYGDAHGWWDERGFLTNLLSSMTSVLFGIPTALLVLGRLGAQQAEALERREIERRARLAVFRFQEAVQQNLAITDMAILRRTLGDLSRRNNAYRRALGMFEEASGDSEMLRQAHVARAESWTGAFDRAMQETLSTGVGISRSPGEFWTRTSGPVSKDLVCGGCRTITTFGCGKPLPA